MSNISLENFSWERMIAAVDAVRERACRAAEALDRAGIPHVVIGGNAVAAWVARVGAEAVRNTKDVDLLVRRQDFERLVAVLECVGFVYRNVVGVDLLEVGLIDDSWCGRLLPELAERLRELIDTQERERQCQFPAFLPAFLEIVRPGAGPS